MPELPQTLRLDKMCSRHSVIAESWVSVWGCALGPGDYAALRHFEQCVYFLPLHRVESVSWSFVQSSAPVTIREYRHTESRIDTGDMRIQIPNACRQGSRRALSTLDRTTPLISLASRSTPAGAHPAPRTPEPQQQRHAATASAPPSSSPAKSHAPPKISPRWLTDAKSRLGKCITFGLDARQTQKAADILRTLGRDWRGMVAGSEGFLSDKRRAGLIRHNVVWGEMDYMVSLAWRFKRAERGRGRGRC
jgi:hypothetical protein